MCERHAAQLRFAHTWNQQNLALKKRFWNSLDKLTDIQHEAIKNARKIVLQSIFFINQIQARFSWF